VLADAVLEPRQARLPQEPRDVDRWLVGPVLRPDQRGQRDVLEHGQVLEEPEVLERAGEASARHVLWMGMRQILVAEQHRASDGVHQPGHDVEQRRLSGTVRADHADDLARRDLHSGLAQCREATELHLDRVG
jgi:hypothetical protein